jgi:hypothetical protein
MHDLPEKGWSMQLLWLELRTEVIFHLSKIGTPPSFKTRNPPMAAGVH